MKTQPNMTEPEVIPQEPDVKPMPKREEPRPKPRRGDPWTVPGPKKNPTPKATNDEVMKDKILIKTKGELEFCKIAMTKEEFYDRCELSMELVSYLCAKKMNAHIDMGDRALSHSDALLELN